MEETMQTINDTSSPQASNQKSVRYGVVAIVFVVFVLLLIFIRSNPQQKSSSSTQNQGASSSQVAGNGKMMLKAKGDKIAVSMGQPITLVIAMDSDGKPVVGYDAIITFDPALVSYTTHTSLVSEFDIFRRAEEGKVLITGVKMPSVTNQVTLRNTNVAEVTFTPKKAGTVQFGFEFVPGGDADSNLLIESAKPTDILGTVEGIAVTIK